MQTQKVGPGKRGWAASGGHNRVRTPRTSVTPRNNAAGRVYVKGHSALVVARGKERASAKGTRQR